GVMVYFLVTRKREMPSHQKEEDIYSREFWLFIGALVLTVACVQIIASTSVPVFNAIFGTDVAPPIDPVQHYNKWQAGFAVVVGLLSAVTQFMKYKRTNARKFFAATMASLLAAAVVTAAIVYITGVYTNFMYILLVFSAAYTIVANGRRVGEATRGQWTRTESGGVG